MINKLFDIPVQKEFSSIGCTDEWEVTKKAEVLREGFSDVLASYNRYFEKHSISLKDRNNLIVKMYFLLVEADKKTLSCKTVSEVDVCYGKLLLGKDFLAEIDHE